MRRTHPLRTRAYRGFLRRLTAAREDRGLSQVAVASALKIPPADLARMEGGTRRVDVLETVVFAKLYRKPLEYFAGGEPGVSLEREKKGKGR